MADAPVGAKFTREYGPVTREMIREFGEASEDRNMIHFSDEIAEKFGLKNVIGHGLMNFSNMVRLLDEWIRDDGRILEVGCEYRGMYRPGDTIITTWEVTGVEGRVLELKLEQVSKTPLYVVRDGEKVESFEADQRGWVSEKDVERGLVKSEVRDGGEHFYRFRTATRGSARVELAR
ncbi:MAG: MaoC family dehydratase [Promethearchaeota archaeon]